ncbi:M1 family aminopeptidase [Adhaeribacter soli]|uniref:Aminopeptidase N n=1 Tax=Adhaeribacter soli TaxID=2607655 RepID=A0A5N1J445_9BACT|nr:M1 family aminopeptidase [Adhaeribacter soli]KAA9345676.1 T9SS type A sorting domain-containing protein [Adhaeribacter soli]
MKKKIKAGLAMLACLVAQQAMAQSGAKCAESRLRPTARVAQTTVSQQRLLNKYDVNFYKLDVALEKTSTYIAGNNLIQAKSRVAALDTFAFELHQDLNIDSVYINGQKRTFTRQAGMTYVRLTTPIAAGNAVNAWVFYKGTPPSGASAAIGNGMSNGTSPSWGNQVTWSLSEPFAAYEWFPVKQILTDKADSSEVWVTTSAVNKVGSNGLLKNTTTLPNGKKRYEWKSRYPIAYYLISVAVAEYVDYTIYANPPGAPNPIPIQNYIYNNPGTLPAFQAEIDNTAPLLVKFSELFGLYPFYKEKYGHCMAPLSGGMEHQTMTTQGFFEFTLTAHELAHQWFGDNVTCASWRDIWLNEGFASYAEYLALQNLRPGQQVAWMNSTHNSVMAAPGGSLYVPAADSMNVNRIFDSRLTYDKGAAVVHMLRFEMNNDALFFATLKTYQQALKDSTAKTPQFKAIAESVSGKNLTPFFNQWVYGEGYPTFSLIWNQVGNNLVFQTTETVSRSTATSFFETDVEYKVTTSVGDTIIRVRQQQPKQFYQIPIRGTISGMQVDPNNWILNRTGTIAKNTSLVSGISAPLAAGQKLNLFPNPTTDWLQVSDLTFKAESIRIFDMAGKQLRSEKPLSPQHRIDVKGLPQGMYLLQFSNKEKTVSAPFQKL